MSQREDPFRGLTINQRRVKEKIDVDYISKSNNAKLMVDPEAKEKFGNTFAGQKLNPAQLLAHNWSQPVDAVVCARIDLDHPLYFSDNKFTNCVDCGCDLQYRPHVPPGEKVCICCCAERIRLEESSNGHP